jgi:Tfp pilus assembly protein PilX
MRNKTVSSQGFILLTVLITTVFVMSIGVVSLQLITSNLRSAKAEQYLVTAQFAADAGLDDAVYHLNQDGTWAGNGTEATLDSNSKFKTTYQTTVTAGSNNFQKFIDVTAKTYAPASSSQPKYTRKYQVEMRGVGTGSYSIVSGVGGLNMVNNSKILGGAVYVNGRLNMANSAQIGLSILPVSVKVADQSCPTGSNPGPTYPRVCTSGDGAPQPISFSGTAKIYGEVQATNQTSGANMYSPGLVAGTPAAAALPDYDRDAQIAAVAHTRTGADASCSLGVKTWQANTKITGDVSVSGICVITVEGDVWITGNLSLANAAILVVKPGVTTTPSIMIDGPNGLTIRNAASLVANVGIPPVGFKVVTFASNAACSPNCSNVTGTDLYNSKDKTTISIENAASAAETEFYARWSKIRINNSGNVGALVGQTVELANAAAITFGTEVSGFSGPTAWVVKSYKRTF